ncbi:hypothetical protein SAMN04488542_1241 [Fontibacillus panacisegetis]|uniref:Uncharacterized protein n=1 Tax=Fontibacillus panacisegetis TaxID=670482 RepID=A0A1G7QX12_9BACL|nr:hypothetical protein SAMN04488542_1241 [Fontibacillus panacisegetis]
MVRKSAKVQLFGGGNSQINQKGVKVQFFWLMLNGISIFL